MTVPLILAFSCLLAAQDTRDIRNGWEIPNEGYADQPYVVKTDDGAWLCELTTGPDGGPHVITYVIDGKLQDGGRGRQFGWGRFSPNFRSANGGAMLAVDRSVERARIYGRALPTSEAIGNSRSGR